MPDVTTPPQKAGASWFSRALGKLSTACASIRMINRPSPGKVSSEHAPEPSLPVHPVLEQEDIITSIFSYLGARELLAGASLVNTQWHRVGTGEQVWAGELSEINIQVHV